MRRLSAIFVFLSLTVALAAANIPQVISFQGRAVTQSAGLPIADGDYAMTFALYTAVIGDTPIWTENWPAVTVSGGLYHVLLGSNEPFGASFNWEQQLYFGISIGSDPEMTPRYQLASSATALDADMVDGYHMNLVDDPIHDSVLTVDGGVIKKAAWGTPTGSDGMWRFDITEGADTTITTVGRWGLTRIGNIHYGNLDSTHVDLGIACTTGQAGLDNGFCTVSGGFQNSASANYSAVSGGSQNSALSNMATVSGGGMNSASGAASTVSGGAFDSASGENATIAGGYHNFAGGFRARAQTVSGGQGNVATGSYSTVAGGVNNVAESDFSMVCGGSNNTASGIWSVVSGGQNNFALGYGSYAIGNQAHANHDGSFVWGDWGDGGGLDTVASERANQFRIRARGGIRLGGVVTLDSLADDPVHDSVLTVEDGVIKKAAWGTPPGSDVMWRFDITDGADTALVTVGQWGLARAGNIRFGNADSTHVNWGMGSTTGMSGLDQMYCTITGGYGNVASGGGAVAGGILDSATGINSTISGGNWNHANGSASTVAGGWGNTAYGNHSTVSGGGGNASRAFCSTVSGGGVNNAMAEYSTVAGGQNNTAVGNSSTVSGGEGDTASGAYSIVSGGQRNTASNAYSTVSGGKSNIASSYGATVAGGEENVANREYTTASGGRSNSAVGDTATVSGGFLNHASGLSSTIGGGSANTTSGYASSIGGGSNNHASGDSATIGGGDYNTASAISGVVGGGSGNTAGGSSYSTVGGGHDNTAGGQYATVGGGVNNNASNNRTTISGGQNNIANHPYTTISGGVGNLAGMDGGTIGGGLSNCVGGGQMATVGGGQGNYANAWYATVGGGYQNYVAGGNSVIPGGSNDTIGSGGTNSVVFGSGVYCNSASRALFYSSANSGAVGINRADHDGGITYPLQVGTTTSNGNNAYLTNGGVWTNASSRTFKDRFLALSGAEILRKISGMELKGWYYKGTDEYHIWPFAEDFYEAFGTGVENKVDASTHLAAGDVAGVGLVAIQELNRKLEMLEQRNRDLEQRVRELEEQRQKP